MTGLDMLNTVAEAEQSRFYWALDAVPHKHMSILIAT
jgi:hypothetical protein